LVIWRWCGSVSPTSGTISTFSGTTSSTASSSNTGYHPTGSWSGYSGTATISGNSITLSLKNFTTTSPTVTAAFAINTKKIKYNANGGSGTISDTTITYNSTATLASSGFTRTNYYLVGWDTDQNATTATYSLGYSVTADMTKSNTLFDMRAASTNGDDKTLYAVWKQSDFGVKDGKSRTDGTWGSQSNPFLIQNATHLTNLAAIVNADTSVTPKPAFDSVTNYSFQTVTTVATTTDFNGCYFEVTASFSANAQFEVIGSSSRHFKGTIVGGGKTITIAVSGSTYVGFIGYLEGGGVSNLTIAGSVTATGNYSGGIAAYAKNTTISNCTNSATINGKAYSGGISGKAEGSTISGCTNSGTISCSGSSYIGGIVGTTDNATISGCTNSASITGAQYTAGIIGRADRGSGTNLTNSGNVNGSGQVAGIVGQANTTATRFALGGTITNTGNIIGTGGMVGGIGGQFHGTFNSGTTITNGQNGTNKGVISGGGDSVGGCFGFTDRTMADITSITNYGAVTGTTSLGGIVGRTQNVITKATNRGTVTSTGGTTSSERPISCTAVGGIAGFSTSGVSNSKNYGTISSSAAVIAVGGIIGTYNSGNTSIAIENCFNEGTINCSSATDVGGIAGYWVGSINHCYNSANVTGSSNVGGIVGYLVSTSSPIQYCLNYNATITGSTKGAILGTSASSSSELQHCFALNSASQGFSGTATNTYNAAGCWSFYASVTPTGNNPKYAVVPSLADANLIPKKNSASTPANTTNSAWKDIVNAADTVDGFAVKISIASGNYFSSRTSDANTDSGYFTPTNVLDAYSSGTDDVIVHYIDTASGNTLYASSKQITVRYKYLDSNSEVQYLAANVATNEYNGTPQGLAVMVPVSSPYSVANTYTGRDGTSYTPAGEYKTIGSDDPNTYTGDYYRKVGNNYINLGPATGNPKQRPANATHWLDNSSAPAPKDAGKYTYSATVKLNGQSVGAVGTSNFEITPRILTITNKWTVVESENSTQTDARNNTISNNSFVFKNIDQGLNEIKVTYDGGTEYQTISADGDLNNDSLFGGVAVFEANVGNFKATDAKNSGSPDHYSYAIELVDKTNFKMSYAGNAAGDNTNGYDTDGVITFTYQIAPRNINSSIDLMAFGYQYNNLHHDIANSAKANAYSLNANTKTWYTASGGGNANDFALNYAASQNDVNALHTAKPALVYIDSQVVTYFKLYFSFNKSTVSEALVRNTDFTLSALGSFSGDAATVGSKDVTITITGQGNYTGNIYVKYTLMRSDFGGQFATAGWGTSTSKPFVIENDAQLLRLSQIVNGETEAWNSWYSKNSTIVTSSTINDSTYKTAYFKIANNATLHAMTAGGFVPIGRRYVDSTVVPVPANYSGDYYTYNGSSYTKDNDNGT
ncbi:MAG: InlB B-repeat-containing protein, partial [Clostridia bacterium]|nr:InlB B-repeat-containing protein [Clostridia bacterium]